MSDPLQEASPGLIKRPQSFEELSEREHFSAPLDHTAHALREVLTDYHFAREVPCGLKSCRQPHKHGFLVITEDGAETNIGQRCGKTHFGEEVFSRARSEYTRRREREELVARAKQIQALAPDISRSITDLIQRPFGAKWAIRVTGELSSVIGEDAVESLRLSTIRDDLAVTTTRRRSDREIEDFMAANRGASRERATYEDQVIGRLLPADWLNFDFRSRLVVDLQGPLVEFKELAVDAMASPKLRAQVKRFDGYDQVLAAASEATTSALRFLAGENLELVGLWLPPHSKDRAGKLRDWVNGAAYRSLLEGASK